MTEANAMTPDAALVEKIAKVIRTYGVRKVSDFEPHAYAVYRIGDWDHPLLTGLDAIEAYDEAAKLNAREVIAVLRPNIAGETL